MWSNEHLLSLTARSILCGRVIDGENSHPFSSAMCPEVKNLQISVLILICLGSPLPPWGPNLFVLSVERSDSEAAEENNFSVTVMTLYSPEGQELARALYYSCLSQYLQQTSHKAGRV